MDHDVDAFKRRRSALIKHSRLSMFATVGYNTPEHFKLSGFRENLTLTGSTGLRRSFILVIMLMIRVVRLLNFDAHLSLQ